MYQQDTQACANIESCNCQQQLQIFAFQHIGVQKLCNLRSNHSGQRRRKCNYQNEDLYRKIHGRKSIFNQVRDSDFFEGKRLIEAIRIFFQKFLRSAPNRDPFLRVGVKKAVPAEFIGNQRHNLAGLQGPQKSTDRISIPAPFKLYRAVHHPVRSAQIFNMIVDFLDIRR